MLTNKRRICFYGQKCERQNGRLYRTYIYAKILETTPSNFTLFQQEFANVKPNKVVNKWNHSLHSRMSTDLPLLAERHQS